MLDRSPIKRRQYLAMIIAADWDVKHQIKQVSRKFEQIFYGYFYRYHFCFRFGYIFGLCDKRIYVRF